jgi:hypothetical protein
MDFSEPSYDNGTRSISLLIRRSALYHSKIRSHIVLEAPLKDK